jgi:hypothetical protein
MKSTHTANDVSITVQVGGLSACVMVETLEELWAYWPQLGRKLSAAIDYELAHKPPSLDSDDGA